MRRRFHPNPEPRVRKGWLRTRNVLAAILVCGATRLSAAAAPPLVEWQASFGGSGNDACRRMVPAGDGGYVLLGTSTSGRSGNKTAPGYGQRDLWLVRIDAAGSKVWDRSFGGSQDEGFYSRALAAAPDGGFLLGGDSWSGVSGNKTSPRRGGEADAWLVKVDATGTKLWDNSFGGSSEYDTLFSILPTDDGGAFLGGVSNSRPSGNKTSPHLGGFDFWLIRVDANGNKVWDKSFGGSGDEGDLGGGFWPAVSLVSSGDGGLLMGGPSKSGVSDNKTGPDYGDYDYWLLRIDADGNKLWDQSFGGNRSDFLTGIARSPDGGFLLSGVSESGISGNKTSAARGGQDSWVVKVDATGNKQWEGTYGDTTDEVPLSIGAVGDGRFVLAGYRFPGWDAQALMLDATGTLLWKQTSGEPYSANAGVEFFDSVHPTQDGGVLLGGQSNSPTSGTKTSEHYGNSDFWLVKLGPGASLAIVHGNGAARISWPRSAGAYLLEGSPGLAPTPSDMSWSEVPAPYETNDTHIAISVPTSGDRRFFRLRSP
ncbi:MAG: hypothetical protein AB7O66_22795 [Limisphaerales bacterium]